MKSLITISIGITVFFLLTAGIAGMISVVWDVSYTGVVRSEPYIVFAVFILSIISGVIADDFHSKYL